MVNFVQGSYEGLTHKRLHANACLSALSMTPARNFAPMKLLFSLVSNFVQGSYKGKTKHANACGSSLL